MKTGFLLILLMSAATAASADQIVLKEGKIIHGLITKETSEEYEIKVNRTMYLRVEKSKVDHVVRDETPTPLARPRWTPPASPAASASPAPKGAPTTTSKATNAPTKKPAATAAAAAPGPSGAAEGKPARKFGTVAIVEDLPELPVRIRARTLNEAVAESRAASERSEGSCTGTWWGVSRKAGDRYEWARAVVISTISMRPALWEPVPPAEAEAWKKEVAEAKSDDEERVRACRMEADAFARSLSVLRLPTEEALKRESDNLFASFKDRTEKRLQAHERRLRDKHGKP